MLSRNTVICGVPALILGLILGACSSNSSSGTGTAGGSPGVVPGAGGTGTGGTTATGGAANPTGGTATGGGANPSGGTMTTTGGSGGSMTMPGTGGTPAGGMSTGGTGGTPAAGGTGGTPATGGAGGMSMGGMFGAGGARPSGPSAGCMKLPPAGEMLGQAVPKMIDVTDMDAQYAAGYTHRKYCTTMPSNYDGTTPLPVVFYGPGCGATGCEGNSFSGHDDFFIVQAIASADAHNGNEVPLGAAPGCFAAGVVGTADNPEAHYFDAVMAEVANTYCIDTGRIFAAGTSSGAWLSNYLACARGNVIRGTAADSGGLQFDHGTCTGGASVMEFPGDTATRTQDGHEIGAALARDMFAMLNGCSATPTTMQIGGDSCDVYGGCDSPIVWCNVGGGHQSGNGHLYPTGKAWWSTLQ